MELMYPYIVFIGVPILVFLVMVNLKKKHIYKKGKKVANTQYTKSIPYYQEIIKKYKIISKVIKAICIMCIMISLILLARPVIVDSNETSMHKRDIYLCMDVSTSVNELNAGLVESLKKIVNNLKDERFGITIFNTSSVILVPLTDDYEYVNNMLDMLSKSLRESMKEGQWDEETLYLNSYIQSGTLIGNETRGSSIIGDGLASCLYNFPDLNEERTRIVIFSTDNDLQGEEIVTLQEAGKIAKEKNITVYGIAPNTIKYDDKIQFENAVKITNGEYYTETSEKTVEEIVENIEKSQKSLIKGHKEIRKIDKPQIPFIILVISIIMLFGLSRKVNL